MNIYNTRQLLKSQSIFDIELWVAYYGRVSSEKEGQKTSIEHQREYYDDFIKGVPKWKFAGRYIDEGISGISAKKREAFQKMMEDAKKGKFDLIITKEISRFARNTLDSIQYTRELLMEGVAVWFQTDNINTLDEDSELRLSIMAAMAQDEIRKLSTRVKFGHARSIKNGVVLGNSMIYGWDKHDGALTINEAEAEMVRTLFQKYSTGLWTTPRLEQYLWDHGYRNRKGGKISRRVIGNIITNPKYKGYYVGGKVRVVDIFTKKQEFLPEEKWTMYKDDGSRVPAIVDEETWALANRYYRARSGAVKGHKSSFKKGNPFTGIIKCGLDGATYWLKDKDAGSLHDTSWVCSHRIKNGACSCASFPVRGSELKKMLLAACRRLSGGQGDAIPRYMQLYREVQREAGASAASSADRLEKEVRTLKQKRDKLLDYNLSGVVPDAEFISRNAEFSQKIAETEKELEKLKRMPSDVGSAQEALGAVLEAAKGCAALGPDGLGQQAIREAVEWIRITPTGPHQADVAVCLKKNGGQASGRPMLLDDIPEPFLYERIPPSSIRQEVQCSYHVRVYL